MGKSCASYIDIIGENYTKICIGLVKTTCPEKKKKTLSDIFENSKHLTLVKYHHRCRLGTGYRCQFSNRHLLVGTNKNNRPLYQNRTGTYKFARAKKKKSRLESSRNSQSSSLLHPQTPTNHESQITYHRSQMKHIQK